MIENIDIGGPTMIRAAAKNFKFVAPVVSPESYDAILAELRESDRRLSLPTRESAGRRGVRLYGAIRHRDRALVPGEAGRLPAADGARVRAGARAALRREPASARRLYTQVGARTHVLSMVSQLGGKELSFNNLLDLDSARLLIDEFQVPACVIVKHNNPCGVAVGTNALEAYRRAFACDPISAYGGVIVLNRRVDRAAGRGARRAVRRGAVRPRL